MPKEPEDHLAVYRRWGAHKKERKGHGRDAPLLLKRLTEPTSESDKQPRQPVRVVPNRLVGRR